MQLTTVQVPGLRALTFDALGTLVRLEPPGPHLRAQLAERFGLQLAPEQAQRAIAAEIAYYRAHLQEGRDADAVLDLRTRCAEELRAALPPAAELIPPDQLASALLASLRFSAYPDSHDALRAARARGLRIVVVSNWDVSLHALLARLSLAPLLHGAVTSAEVGVGKPAREIFERALELAGEVEPAAALHVGDDVQADYEGARAAGLRALLLARDGASVPPGIDAIPDLRALP
jgi:putative hydrolase of the HAD superfamily